MEWWSALLLILGGLVFFMLTGMPTAFCFLFINIIAAFVLWGGEIGLNQLVLSMGSSVTIFSLVPIVLFVLMGGILFQSGIGGLIVTTINKWLGRLPGRLSFLSILAGTLFSTLSGSSMASVAMLGSTMVPEMEKYKYQKAMSIGPILGAGTIAMMVPPSGLGVFIAVVAGISVGKFLIAIIIPGIMLAVFMGLYILIRCMINPSLAPPYDVKLISMSEKVLDAVRYLLPLLVVVFLVTGVIIVGVATPSEAAATGCLGTFLLTMAYRRFNWKMVKNSLRSTVRLSSMILLIMASATAFSQVLAFSGATSGLIDFVMRLNLPPLVAVIGIQVLIAIMGAFMHVHGIIMIILPLFVPIVEALGLDPTWFAVLTLLNCELAGLTPPFGMMLFVMKGVAPDNTSFQDVVRAGLPFLAIAYVVLICVIVFPHLTLWLPKVLGTN